MRTLGVLLALTSLVLSLDAIAQDAPADVLFIGDTAQRQIFSGVGNGLKGKVRVQYMPTELGASSGVVLEHLDTILGDRTWSLIYFNFGLADLHYKDPRTTDVRAMSKQAGGVRVTTPEQYRTNLQQIVQRLQQTDATLVWGSTTPIIETGPLDSLYDVDSEREYNVVAAEVMQKAGAIVVDLHAHALKQYAADEKHPRMNEYHRLPKEKTPLAAPLIEAIARELGLTLPSD